MSDEAAVPEFFCVEFNHPVRGWSLLRDVCPRPTFESAQQAIVMRLSERPASRREKTAMAYRVVRYVREAAT